MIEIKDRMTEVNSRIDRVAEFYRYGGRDRHWVYERSELSNRWNDLRADINDLARQMNRRR